MTTRAKILEILAQGELAEESNDSAPGEIFRQTAILKYLSVIAHSLFEEE